MILPIHAMAPGQSPLFKRPLVYSEFAMPDAEQQISVIRLQETDRHRDIKYVNKIYWITFVLKHF
jgi:hypothetical protein